jgi:uncharacterized coiled-coil DUF342 family protein
MTDNSELIKRIKKLENEVKAYEPLLISIQELPSISDNMGKLYTELQHIKKSKDITKENLIKLSKDQNKVYDEVVRVLSERSKELEKEINDCPIKTIVHDIEIIKSEIYNINKFISSFKTLFIK